MGFFWLLYLFLLIPTYFSCLEETRPLVQQAAASKAQLQACHEAFLWDFPPWTPSKPALAVPPQSHLFPCRVCFFIFILTGHCSAVENNRARKPGFVPSSQVLFLSCLGVGWGAGNEPLWLCVSNGFLSIGGGSFALWVLIVAAGGEKPLISASQSCSEGEKRPTVLAAACAQRYKNLLQLCTRGTPQRMATFSLWVKDRNIISEVKGRSYSLGEG